MRTDGAVRGVPPRYRFWMITVRAWNSATKLSATVANEAEATTPAAGVPLW